MHERRVAAFDQLDRSIAKSDEILKGLKPLAGIDFSAFAKAADV
jgi:hypothetical protein